MANGFFVSFACWHYFVALQLHVLKCQTALCFSAGTCALFVLSLVCARRYSTLSLLALFLCRFRHVPFSANNLGPTLNPDAETLHLSASRWCSQNSSLSDCGRSISTFLGLRTLSTRRGQLTEEGLSIIAKCTTSREPQALSHKLSKIPSLKMSPCTL